MPPALGGVLFRGAAAGALKRQPGVERVGLLGQRLRILEGGAIEVAHALGLLARPERRRGGAAQGGEEQGARAQQCRPSHHEITSTPLGTSNRNSESLSPTFSLNPSKTMREVEPSAS